MNRTASSYSYNKQNPSNPTHYKTSLNFYPISHKQKQLTSNIHVIDNLIIQSETILDKLKQKINLDQIKIQQNYVSLQQLSQDMQQSCSQITNNKQIQNIIKTKKEAYKDCFVFNKTKVQSIRNRIVQEQNNLQQIVQGKQKQLEQQKEQRQMVFSKMIDQFEQEIGQIQRQFKMMRREEESSNDKVEVLLYNLEQMSKDRVEMESKIRKGQHETIIKLIGQCIQNFRYVY